MTKETVFIVDDDAAICEGLSNLLDAVGIITEQYASAEAFWETWDDSRAGCVLLDARLPGASGVDFQDQVRRLGIDLPIIFMTAHGDVPMVRKVMKAGAIEFLTKPFQKEELLHAVRQAFDQDRARREQDAIVSGIKERINSVSDREREVMGM